MDEADKKAIRSALKKMSEVAKSDISDPAKILYMDIFARNALSMSWIRYRRCDDALRNQLGELERIEALKLHHSNSINEECIGYTLILDDTPDTP